MSLESKNDKKKEATDEIIMPDFTEIWKEMYFKNEAAIAEAFKDFISTQNFVGFLNKTLDQHLSYEKVIRQSIDKYMEMTPVPSKKDISRVAELVISLEEKIDVLEYQFSNTMDSITNSLIKMVDYQAGVKDEIASLRDDLTKLEKKVDNISKKITTLDKEKATAKKKTTTKDTKTTKASKAAKEPKGEDKKES